MNATSSTKTTNVLLWIAQVLVALMLFFGAFAKLFQPIEEAAKMLPWASESPLLLRFTGLVDLLGALGLLLPSLLKIQPKLTVYAAIGTVLLMVLAIGFHVSRGEAASTPFNVVLLLLAVFIAWGRSKKAVIQAR